MDPSTTPPPTAQTLRELLETQMFERKLNQRQLAALLGVTEPRLSDLLLGKRKLRLDFARLLHSRLGIPGDILFTLRDC